MLDLSIVNGQEEFASLRDEWNRLLERSENMTVFQRWEWLYNWWLAYGRDNNELFICVARDRGEIVGIAPFFIKKRYFATVRTISFLGSNIVGSDYLDIIAEKNREQEINHAILNYLQKSCHLWDFMELNGLPAKSPTLYLLENDCDSGNTIYKSKAISCPFISLKAPWNTILSNYSPKLKNTISRKLKKLHDQYNGRFIAASKTGEIAEYYEQFVQLNLIRFKEKKLTSPFSKPAFVHFHQAVISDLHKIGIADLYFLEVNKQLIAGIYLLLYNNKCYFYQSGYDPAWGHLSPGTLLLHHSIKTAHDNGYEEFDLLRGMEKYKYEWARMEHENVNLNVYQNTRKGRALLVLQKMKRNASNLLRIIMNWYHNVLISCR